MSHCISGRISFPRVITILTVIGYLLYWLTSLMYTILIFFPYYFQIWISSSLCKKYLKCSTFSTKIEWLYGTFWEGFKRGLYSLQSCLISGYFFFVSFLISFFGIMAIVREIGCSLRIGISMTSSSLSLIKKLLKRKEIICWRGTN